MCAKHYTRWYRHGTPNHDRDGHDQEARVQACINKGVGCWEWTGTIRHDGYGQTRFDGRLQRAHRVVYEMTVGPIPKGLDIDHLCRNRSCVNPEHLEPVTSGENIRRSPIVTAPEQADRLNNRP